MPSTNTIRKNKELIFTIVFSTLLLVILFFSKVICCNDQFFKNENLHFNILSVNAIIAGFLFTGLSIIISVIDKERIKRLSENGYLDVFYNTIFAGILFHVISITFAIMNILKVLQQALLAFGYIEIGFLIMGLILFIRAVFYLKEIIRIIKSSN